MMSIEETLREALHEEAERADVAPGGWAEVQQNLGGRGRWSLRRTVFLSGAAAVMVGLVALVSLSSEESSDRIQAGGPAAEPTTVSPPVAVEDLGGVWPFASRGEAQAYASHPEDRTFLDPEATALAFARTQLGMPEAESSSGFVGSTDGSTGGVAVRDRPGSAELTRITLRRHGGPGGPYEVTGADTDRLRVESPTGGGFVGQVIVVEGEVDRSISKVVTDVRGSGRRFGQSIAQGSATVEPQTGRRFAAVHAIEDYSSRAGAVLVLALRSDGSVEGATLVGVVITGSCRGLATSSPSSFDPEKGTYAVLLTAIDRKRRILEFDLIQWLSGREAVKAYREDQSVDDHPQEDEGPPNDYWIRNENEQLREVAVAPSAVIRLIQPGDTELRKGTFEELSDSATGSDGTFWLTMRDESVVAICEQYRP